MIGYVGALMGAEREPRQARSTVLVVDDEPDILDAVKGLLERAIPNVLVKTAASGTEGLQVLRDGPVDLILTDYKMPGMNGIEFLEAARRIAPQAPRILLTAFERELVAEMGPNGQVSQIFTKPLNPKPFLQTCQRMLASRA